MSDKMLGPIDAKTVNVKAVLATRLDSVKIGEHDFLTAFEESLKTYFEGHLNAMAGNDSDMQQAINDIVGFAYGRMDTKTPAEMALLEGDTDLAMELSAPVPGAAQYVWEQADAIIRAAQS